MNEQLSGTPSTGMSGAEKQGAIGIIVALRLEEKRIRKALDGWNAVHLVAGGIGEEKAYHAGMSLRETKPDLLISAGLAGALVSELEIGDLVVSDFGLNLTQLDGNFRKGTIACSRVPVTDPALKHLLSKEAGAIAVDMESAGVAIAASELGIPFLAIKAISDRLESSFPANFNRFFRSDGKLSPGMLARSILRDPETLTTLLQIRQDAHRAADSLAAFLRLNLQNLLIFSQTYAAGMSPSEMTLESM